MLDVCSSNQIATNSAYLAALWSPITENGLLPSDGRPGPRKWHFFGALEAERSADQPIVDIAPPICYKFNTAFELQLVRRGITPKALKRGTSND